MATGRNDEDDVDARFQAVIAENFPREVPGVDEPLTVVDRMDRADALDPDQDWTPPAPRPLGPWPPAAIAGAALLGLALGVGLLGLLGARLPTWAGPIAAGAAVVGLAVLLGLALRRRPRPRDDDGAVL